MLKFTLIFSLVLNIIKLSNLKLENHNNLKRLYTSFKFYQTINECHLEVHMFIPYIDLLSIIEILCSSKNLEFSLFSNILILYDEDDTAFTSVLSHISGDEFGIKKYNQIFEVITTKIENSLKESFTEILYNFPSLFLNHMLLNIDSFNKNSGKDISKLQFKEKVREFDKNTIKVNNYLVTFLGVCNNPFVLFGIHRSQERLNIKKFNSFKFLDFKSKLYVDLNKEIVLRTLETIKVTTDVNWVYTSLLTKFNILDIYIKSPKFIETATVPFNMIISILENQLKELNKEQVSKHFMAFSSNKKELLNDINTSLINLSSLIYSHLNKNEIKRMDVSLNINFYNCFKELFEDYCYYSWNYDFNLNDYEIKYLKEKEYFTKKLLYIDILLYEKNDVAQFLCDKILEVLNLLKEIRKL